MDNLWITIKPQPMAAGYSGTPLLKKLGIREDMKILLVHPPDNYFDLLEKNISGQLVTKKEIPDWIHLFATTKTDFSRQMQQLRKFYKANPAITIWVSWYKKSSGMATDMTEDIIRHYALQNDLVDVKVCAVSEQWSGLKLLVPLSKR